VGLASFVHATVAVLGIATLLAASPRAFHAVQYAGAAWLVWLGNQAFRAHGDSGAVDRSNKTALSAVFAEGFTVNILNPKGADILLRIPAAVCGPGARPVSAQVAWLGGTFAVLGMLTDSTWAMAAHAAGRYLARHARIWRSRHYVPVPPVYAGAGRGACRRPDVSRRYWNATHDGPRSHLDLLAFIGMTTLFGNPGRRNCPCSPTCRRISATYWGYSEAVVVGWPIGYAQATGRAAIREPAFQPRASGNALGNIYTAYENQTPLVITAASRRAPCIRTIRISMRPMRLSSRGPWVKWKL